MTETVTGPLIDELRQNEQHAAWLNYLAQLDPPDADIDLPDDAAMSAILRELDVPAEDIPTIIAERPDRSWTPDRRWLFERSAQSILSTMGSVDRPPWFPSPLSISGLEPFFFVYVFVAAFPHTKRYHESRGIPDEQSREILADLGRNVRVHRKRHGVGGLGVSFWLMLHFRGAIYQLGRLQFERARMGTGIADALTATGVPASPEELVLSLHIPDFLGPLSPDAVESSVAEASRFFAAHFPEERYRYAVCHSWLLDPQLAEYLSEQSNIVRFQRRFSLAPDAHDVDTSIVQFVFGPVPESPRDLPERSSLERAVKQHLVSGRHWQGRSGWFRLTGSDGA